MTVTPVSYIVFYSFIAIIVGVGLYFSRAMDRDVKHYFWAGMSKGSGVIAVSVFLIAFLNSLIVVLPSLPSELSSFSSVGVVSAAVIFPLMFGKQLFISAGNLIDACAGMCKLFLSVHGFIFLCSVQILVLLQISDFVIIQIFGDTHYSMLVVMIVAAGIYTMVGGLNAVLYSNIIVGGFSVFSILLILFNSVFLKHPLFFSFKTTLQSGADVFRSAGITEANLAIAVCGVVIMMFWIMWMEFGETQRKVSVKTSKALFHGLIGSSVLLFVTILGVLLLANSDAESVQSSFATNLDMMNYQIALSFLGGLMGVFAITFQSVGSLVALRLYPFFKHDVGEEEQILVGRLSTVFVVLLSILLISFAKSSESSVLIWYINFLAFFSTPIVAAFLSSLFLKKGSAIGFMLGIFIGEVYACIAFIIQKIETHSSFLQSTSAYAFAIEIAIVTFFISILSAKASEMIVVQRLLSRIKISRSM